MNTDEKNEVENRSDGNINVLIIGGPRVGKTRLCQSFTDNYRYFSFNYYHASTYSDQYQKKLLLNINYDNGINDDYVVNIKLITLPGNISLSNINYANNSQYEWCYNSDIAFIMYEYGNNGSFDEAKNRLDMLKERWKWNQLSKYDKIIALICNKCDFAPNFNRNNNNNGYYDENGHQFAQNEGIYYYEFSRWDYSEENTKLNEIARDLGTLYWKNANPYQQRKNPTVYDKCGTIGYDFVTILISFLGILFMYIFQCNINININI